MFSLGGALHRQMIRTQINASCNWAQICMWRGKLAFQPQCLLHTFIPCINMHFSSSGWFIWIEITFEPRSKWGLTALEIREGTSLLGTPMQSNVLILNSEPEQLTAICHISHSPCSTPSWLTLHMIKVLLISSANKLGGTKAAASLPSSWHQSTSVIQPNKSV